MESVVNVLILISVDEHVTGVRFLIIFDVVLMRVVPGIVLNCAIGIELILMDSY